VLKDLARWVHRSTKARANSKQSSLAEKIILLGRATVRIGVRKSEPLLFSQRDEYSLCTSKFESDMPSHGVGLYDVSRRDALVLNRFGSTEGSISGPSDTGDEVAAAQRSHLIISDIKHVLEQ
jgi:hypothetical protein